MRGDTLHNQILIGSLAAAANEYGANIKREHPIRVNGKILYIDLLINLFDQITACEAETLSLRDANGIFKAQAIGATTLLITTPTARIARVCRRRQLRLPSPKANLQIIICPLGAALNFLHSHLTAIKTQNTNERNLS